ncbi:Ada metal-binding domain-containing protein [Chondrinema litorale]|uniref:Ada metal-binding domain-containing protein n=1 Tax=Chondrinema litorale TaxID=2994555 RepID=UPI002542A76A|nr:Ada metal-binding domain-containing protein [Chondrinema litorale]UZR98816.1 metal-binding protein [Chondrinema litorale]
MIQHNEISSLELKHKIRSGEILFGGNKKLKIYGQLKCKSGKRMLQQNRVFFTSEEEAIEFGYRPCGNCMKTAYNSWQKKKLDGFI